MYFQFIDRIEINPTELCNLKCSFCPRSQGYPNSNLNVSEETCLEIRKQLDVSGYNNKVSITGRGEPTLTKNFKRILYILLENKPMYDVYMNTNGKKLDDLQDMFHLFWRINLDIYDVDVNVYQHAVEKYREWNNIDVRHRPDTGAGYIEYNKKCGAKFSNRGGVLGTNNNKSPCGFLFNKIYINWNGDYNLCCDDWHHQMVLSNIHEQDIVEYVNNNKTLKYYRDMHMSGKRDCLHICGGCDRVANINKLAALKVAHNNNKQYN